eukprot:GABW01004769.1.p1 GENE.GABW01004769.1~~GABW01004769.1.p1  ORF type:complete len:95 (-),score=16.53 GABW01004769.1:3-287(-)
MQYTITRLENELFQIKNKTDEVEHKTNEMIAVQQVEIIHLHTEGVNVTKHMNETMMKIMVELQTELNTTRQQLQTEIDTNQEKIESDLDSTHST